jgi:hypothetical protein
MKYYVLYSLLMTSWLLHADDSVSLFSANSNKSTDLLHVDGKILESNEYLDISIDENISNMLVNSFDKSGDESTYIDMSMTLDGMKYELSIVKAESYVDGYISYVALIDNNEIFPAFFTIYDNKIYGDFYTPEGMFRADTYNSQNKIIKPSYFEKQTSIYDIEEYSSDGGVDDNLIFENADKQKSWYPYGKPHYIRVGFVLTNAVGGSSNSSTISYLSNAVNAANWTFVKQLIYIQLWPHFYTNLNPGYENSFNNDVNIAQSTFRNVKLNTFTTNMVEGFNLSVPQSPYNFVTINQFVLVMGPGDGVCGKAGFARQISQYLTIRKASNCNTLTLAHEIGHNLTLIHDDGASKPPVNTNGVNFGGWQSIMNQVGSYQWKYFTGGENNSEYDILNCNGICNSEPYAQHDSAFRLNAARWSLPQTYVYYDTGIGDNR